MTMIGRFQLQKLLKEMVDTGCKYAIMKTTSKAFPTSSQGYKL